MQHNILPILERLDQCLKYPFWEVICVGLPDALHDVAASQVELMSFRNLIFAALYDQSSGTSMTKVQVIYQNKTKITILPKSYSYLNNRVLHTHLQVLKWKVADQQVPYDFDGIARSVLLFWWLQHMVQANLNLSMWLNTSVRPGKRNVVLMHVVAEKIIFLAHHIAAVLGKKDATNHIQTTCIVRFQEWLI